MIKKQYVFHPVLILIFCCLSLSSVSSTDVEVLIHKNDESGLLTWEANQDGFSIELIQLLPDFVRAIYANHDFPTKEIERIANYCVFGTIIKNTSEQALRYDVSEWFYQAQNDIKHRVKTKTRWLDEWHKAGIIFSWTLLPDFGDFEIGDWQQGFTTIKLERKAVFDLTIKWTIENIDYGYTLEDISCAPENLIE